MNILWLTPQFPSNINSIKGIYLYRTVKYLSKNFDIETWYLYPKIPPFFSMIKSPLRAVDIFRYWRNNLPKNFIKLPGIKKEKIFLVKYYRLPRAFFHFFEAYFIFWAARKRIFKFKKDTVIYSNWIFPAGHLAYLMHKKFKIPYTVALLGTDVHKLKYGTFYWKTAKKVIENANYVTSVSQELLNRCKNEKITIPEEKSILVDNIYDNVKFKILEKSALREKHNFNSNHKIIFYAGGLVEIKNVDVLLKAFDKIKNPNFNLIIAGKGAEESKLKKLASSFSLSQNIVFVGNLQSNELVEYYNLADVLCLPSKNEGTPNVIVEALLCGTPIVASNVGGIPKLINDNKNGILVPKNNSKLLAYALQKAALLEWNREELRNSVSRFFPENVVKNYQQLFNSLKNELY